MQDGAAFAQGAVPIAERIVVRGDARRCGAGAVIVCSQATFGPVVVLRHQLVVLRGKMRLSPAPVGHRLVTLATAGERGHQQALCGLLK